MAHVVAWAIVVAVVDSHQEAAVDSVTVVVAVDSHQEVAVDSAATVVVVVDSAIVAVAHQEADSDTDQLCKKWSGEIILCHFF